IEIGCISTEENLNHASSANRRNIMNKKDDLIWIQNWYARQCDGDWEHQFGVRLETLDNPGWSIRISVQETELQEKEFKNLAIERTENDWIFCKVENGFFMGDCGPLNLPEMLTVFREWAEAA